MSNQLLLTLDVEDFINDASIEALHSILLLLKRHGLSGLFFLNGHVAEKLGLFPSTVALLEAHEIGFHSSAHSGCATLTCRDRSQSLVLFSGSMQRT